ncbi:hypothetical protein [Arthrobacter sp. 08Y14]|uniref:hypothetical protein n=1 Tax=Arthrobacter sp. 08Y14 TaxID=2058885 RepID=UPI000CE445A6|nr:hypothetical protein [Arthrobacter sp. 08Y14]
MLVIALLMLGITTPLWSTVDLLRRIGELHNQSIPNQLPRHHAVFPNRIAVLIAAHNEERVIVIAETIASAKVLVPCLQHSRCFGWFNRRNFGNR